VNTLLLLAICASIRPSVTLVIHAPRVQYIEMSFAPSDRSMLDARFLSRIYAFCYYQQSSLMFLVASVCNVCMFRKA